MRHRRSLVSPVMHTGGGRSTDGILPHFMGIGAAKSGTTWLALMLRHHPDTWLPPFKELHYFCERFGAPRWDLARKLFSSEPWYETWRHQARSRLRAHRTGRARGDFGWDLRYFLRRPGDSWYADLFREGRGKLVGEITPCYATLPPGIVAHISRLVPDLKIVFFLRNPVERAWSEEVMFFTKASDTFFAKEGPDSFRDIPDDDLMRHARREQPMARSTYSHTIRTWTSYFPPEQIFIGYMEDVSFHPRELLHRLFGHLGLADRPLGVNVEKKVYEGKASVVPMKFVRALSEMYLEELERLDGLLGGYASLWYEVARVALDSGPTEEDLVYPYWDSPRWCPPALRTKLTSLGCQSGRLDFLGHFEPPVAVPEDP